MEQHTRRNKFRVVQLARHGDITIGRRGKERNASSSSKKLTATTNKGKADFHSKGEKFFLLQRLRNQKTGIDIYKLLYIK